MSTQPTNQESIEQLRRDVAAFAEEMRRPAPSAASALVPFGIGAALALTFIVVGAVVARLL
jgi:alpha-beta hydrolase superfamily lysophospholipase